jgi:hypothetical protein
VSTYKITYVAGGHSASDDSIAKLMAVVREEFPGAVYQHGKVYEQSDVLCVTPIALIEKCDTIDDQNDAIRARVEEEIGDMPMGLTEEERDEWQAEADRLFFQFRGGSSVSMVTRFPSGEEIYTNRAGRCEDAPCCGCCS